MFGFGSKKPGYDRIRSRRDNRRSERRLTRGQATIRLNGGFASRPCTVLDLSDTGVRISVAGIEKIPDAFTLLQSQGSRGRSARVKWRRGNQIGAEFV
jgi:hypothetical protein